MDSLLRDFDREYDKIQSDLITLQRHHDQFHGYWRKYMEAQTVSWAKLVSTHPKALLLIIETTHIYGSNEIEPIRITTCPLMDRAGIEDQLLAPTFSRQIDGTAYHGLSLSDLEGQPCFAEIWENLKEKLESHQVIVFGLDWAERALREITGEYHVLSGAFCLHNKCKEFFGQFYELSLEVVLSYQGIDKPRAELTDSRERIQVLAQVVGNIALGRGKIREIPNTPSGSDVLDELGDLSEHPF